MADSDYALELRGVSVVFDAAGLATPALDNVDLTLRKGEFVSLIGPSGCGKSTILRLLADILQPSAGIIRVGGLSPREARLKRRFSFMFQDPVMFPWRDVQSNVELPLELLRIPVNDRRSKVAELLEKVQLGGFGRRRPNQLSGGMKMRASLARALSLNPPLILMDEPFGALDEITRDTMNQELLSVWEKSTASVLLVTHSIEEAVFLSDRVVVLSARPGRVAKIVDINVPRPRPTHFAERTRALSPYLLAVREGLHHG